MRERERRLEVRLLQAPETLEIIVVRGGDCHCRFSGNDVYATKGVRCGVLSLQI